MGSPIAVCYLGFQELPPENGRYGSWNWRPLGAMSPIHLRGQCPHRVGRFVDLPVLHDDEEVIGGVFDQLDVLERVAVHQQQVGQCALSNDAQPTGIRIARPGQRQQLHIVVV
jgi:hypothetical protein